MNNPFLTTLVAGVAAVLMSLPAAATIIGGSVTGGTAASAGGTFVKLTPPLSNPFGSPNSVGNDNFQSPNLFGFDENQNIVLGAGLSADILAGAPLVAGDTVASHYIFFDPLSTLHMMGTVNFAFAIVAVLTTTGTLAASDFLANTGINYLNPTLRGLEAGDFVTISGAQQITFDTSASSPGDYIRVLTAFSPSAVSSVPEPSTLALFTLGLVGFAASWRRRA